MNLERIATVAAAECVRQQVGLFDLSNLLLAYEYAYDHRDKPLTEGHIRHIAFLIDQSNTHYRKLPVVFANGGSAVLPGNISLVMNRLYDMLHDLHEENIDAWIKSYLEVHPWIDGNGRSAWILHNWLNGTLDNPDPLPEFRFM